jgi:uncharacterized protein (TIGR02996 family)
MAQYRAMSVAHFRARALEEFRRRPETRSLLFAVAQYWNDQADDEVHDLVIASPRDVPAWPHICEGEEGDEGQGSATPGDRCNQLCDYEMGGVGTASDVFARFCHEYGSQDRPDHENHTPYAIARRRGGGAGGDVDVEIEVIGKLWRPEEDMVPDEPEAGPRWLELPRARELYELICASPGDDEPRRVLGDRLLEHGHPRGELIALSLAGAGAGAAPTAPEVLARRDELLAAHGRQWLSPLGAVIPETGARWERGFLVRAEVFLAGEPPPAVRGAAAWGTVETLRFLRDDLIDPAMVALRDVGPVRGRGLRELAAAARPWAIERLHAVLEEPDTAAALWGARTLPRLTHLVLEGPYVAAALARPRPPWWPQLERLAVVLDCDTSVEKQEAGRRPHAGIAPWVAVAQRSSLTCDLGWEIATGPGSQIELSLAGWHEAATAPALCEIVAALPPDAELRLRPSRHWAPLPEDAARLAAGTGRELRLAG